MMRALFLFLALVAPIPALAHDGHEAGLVAGFLHPLTGPDHLAAMVAVGLWAGILGGRAMLRLPVAFLGGMVFGGALAAVGIAIPFVEHGILASVIVLGALVAGAARLPAVVAMAMAAGFGLLHGHAHGVELAADFGASVPGFLVATALLHGAGLLLVAAASEGASRLALRCAGGITAAVAFGVLVLPA